MAIRVRLTDHNVLCSLQEIMALPPTRLTTNDLLHHYIKFGFDIFPPIDISVERTRLNIFAEEARNQLPNLAEKFVGSDTEFVLSKTFKAKSGPASASAPTFALTDRGPCFMFPVQLAAPIGDTGLEGDIVQLFETFRRLFFNAIPGRDILRIGMVRELIFDTGQELGVDLISPTETFAGAAIANGQRLLTYKDQKYNHQIKIATVEIGKETRLGLGKTVREQAGHGLQVSLDVNNIALRSINDDDISETIERATGLWPDALLQYLCATGGTP